MAWTKRTGRFGSAEMAQLEAMPAQHLARVLLNSDAIVALRGVAEVMLNGDKVKLTALLADEALTAHWEAYAADAERDSYAEQLRAAKKG